MPTGSSNFTTPDALPGRATYDNQVWGSQGKRVDANGNPIQGTSGLEQDVERYRSMGSGGPQSGPQIDQTRSNETRDMSMGSLGLLEQTAMGTTASAAERLGQQQTQAAQNAQTSMGASVRGGAMARAAAGRAATMGAATVGQVGEQQQQATRAAEMEGARGAYNSAVTAQRGQDLGVATSQANLEMGQRNSNEQRDQFYENLGYNTKKAGMDQALGRTAAESAAANANRAQGLVEQAQGRTNTNQMISTGVGGAQGAMQGYAKTQSDPYQDPNKTLSDERSKAKIVPLTEDAGTERHWDSDVSKSAPDVTSGASISGPVPKYASKGNAPAKAKSAPKKAQPVDLKKLGDEMLAAQGERSAASLGAGASVGKAKTAKDIPTPYDTPEPARPEMTRDSMFTQVERDTAGAAPYAAAQNDSPFGAGVPKGYAQGRHGQDGAMFGPKPVWPAHDSKQYDRDIMLSDDHAKLAQAWEEGRDAQIQQFAKVSKMSPDELKSAAATTPGAKAFLDAKGDAWDEGKQTASNMRGARGLAKSAGGRAAATGYRRADPSAQKHDVSERENQETRGYTEMAKGAAMMPVMPAIGIGHLAGGEYAVENSGAYAAPAAAPPRQMQGFQREQPGQEVALSDARSKRGAGGVGSMAEANRSMAPSMYEYKPQYAGEAGQKPGEKNVGPMAQHMAADPIASTAIVKRPDGLLAIDKDKGIKLLMGGLADLQNQVDSMQRKKASR